MQANTLLIVEGDPDIRACLEEIMVSEGFEVLTAAHGREALQALQSAQTLPALILLDLTMPVMDGPQFLAELASGRWPEAWQRIPVLVLTAISEPFLAGGVAEVVRKPVDIGVLIDAVARHLPVSLS